MRIRIGLTAALAVSMAAPVTPAGAAETGTQELIQLREAGSGVLSSGGLTEAPPVDRATEFPAVNLDDFVADIVGGTNGPIRSGAPLAFPTVSNTRVSLVNRGFSGFDGLNHADQRLAGTGIYKNSQFSLEPPDQALCVGNGFVVEAVNTAVAVYRADTHALVSGPTALNQFFGLAPEVIRTPPARFGDFTSDPRCIFDRATNRFFLILLQLDVDPPSGGFTGGSSQLIAVSKSGNPADGWNFYKLNTTAHGTSCPCFGDQPLMGADDNGFFLSANAFSLVTGRFVGVQIYAMSKRALAAGRLPPFVLHLSLPAAVQADGSRDFSVQPAVSQRSGDDDDDHDGRGTEFFLGAFNTRLLLNDQLAAYSLQPTSALNFPPTAATTFSFQKVLTPSEVYGVPPDALQKRGTLPLGSVGDPKIFEMLATNEHRMQQVTYARGQLWGAVTTGLQSPGEADQKAGVAWFAVRVESERGGLEARVHRQGYVAVANASTFFPAVGVAKEQAAIGFSISGPALFPSTGYVQISEDGKTGPVHIAGVGPNSEDGFTGYPALSGGSPCNPPNPDGTQLCESRWGDYGAAAVDEHGNIWLASEYVSPRPRTVNANWGTFVTKLSAGEDDDRGRDRD